MIFVIAENSVCCKKDNHETKQLDPCDFFSLYYYIGIINEGVSHISLHIHGVNIA